MAEVIKIAWFGAGFVGRSASGTAQTARKAIVNLSKFYGVDIEITILLKSYKDFEIASKDSDLVNCKLEILDNKNRKFLSSSRQFYKYCWSNRKNKIFDILHFSVPRVYPFFDLFPASKFVATFHAGGDVTIPQDKFILSRWIYNWIVKLQWSRFNQIIADSNFGVMEISNAYSIPIDRISKVYLGADSYWPLNLEEHVKKPNEVTIVGRWQKYKNVHTAINAIAEFNIDLLVPLNVQLIGKSNQLGHNLVKQAISSFSVGELRTVDYLSDTQLAELYRETTIVIHPSINEGFGLPAFEAFGEGAVLIIHAGTPASELLSDFSGVIIENLTATSGVKKALDRALKSFEIDIVSRRKYLFDIGATWQDMAKNYLETYRKLL